MRECVCMKAPPGTDDPIVLPTPGAPARRGSIPIVAAFVPVIGAVAMWLFTGYALMLCFAAIGPLMAVASLVDSGRGRRRERRSMLRELAVACEAGHEELRARHARERAELERCRPDAAALVGVRTLWRQGAGRIVLGRGRVRSAVRVSGGEGDAAEELRWAAAWVGKAPVEVGLADAGGICVQGPAPIAAAVARAFLLQLCLRASPRELSVTALLPGDQAALTDLPHARASRHPAGAVAGGEPLRVAVVARHGGGATPAASAIAEADAVIVVTDRGAEVPAPCGVVLELGARGGLLARRLDDTALDEAGEPIIVEALSLPQAARTSAALAARSDSVQGAALPAVGLADLLREFAEGSMVEKEGGASGLAVPIGRGSGGPTVVDLVNDGPHAVVVGITGSGKSELLCTWIAALASSHGHDRVTFLLADFKGGTAFAPLATLPHVTGVITDLDGTGSRRAVESLRAELRRREAEIAAAGAADIADPRVDLPRLVIVVDEFAALLQEHGDLAAVFTDVAARGRALGMHLVLGTQRAAGVLREALLANCQLRIALRAADPADSRAVVGTDDAALLPGDADSRGVALVRRGGDVVPERTRIARAGAETIDAACASGRWGADAGDAVRSPWLPPLPMELALTDLREHAEGDRGGSVLLGLADEPERQRQPVVRLTAGRDRGIAIIGGAGAGKSTAVHMAAAQMPGAVVIPSDPETAWDVLESVTDHPPEAVVIDDIDALLARYPAEYAQEFAARAEALVREAGESATTVIMAASRMSGAVERITSGLPMRALLRLGSRADHLQAGGDGRDHEPNRPPGRAVLDGREMQFALPDETARPAQASAAHAGERGVRGFGDSGADAAPATRAQRKAARTGSEGGAAVPAAASGRRGVGGETAHPTRRAGATVGDGTWVPRGVAAFVTTHASSRAPRLADAWKRTVRVVGIDSLEPGARLAEVAAGAERFAAVGDGESWLRHAALLRQIRAAGDLVVAAECPHELRTIAGERTLPPFARMRANRAWLVSAGQPPRRVVLPA